MINFRNDDVMTVLFPMNAWGYEGNPFAAETPFGKPTMIGMGDAFSERDVLEDRLNNLLADVHEAIRCLKHDSKRAALECLEDALKYE